MLTLLRQAANSLGGSDETEPETEESDERERPDGSLLHRCPTCEEVYLSDGPRECSRCRKQTVPVRDQRQDA